MSSRPQSRKTALVLAWLAYALAALAVAADQLSKLLIFNSLGPGSGREVVDLFGGMVQLRYATNSGAAFSILAGRSMVFAIVATIVVAGIVVYLRVVPPSSKLVALSLGLIMGGAAGNLIDRLRYGGSVIDFIYTRFWPTFNVADAAVVAGVAFLVLHILISSPSSAKTANTDALPKN